MEFKSISFDKLLELTEVPGQFLEAILEGNNAKLPPAPYVRGYFIKVALALDLDAPALWQIYKRQTNFQSSGINDRLPHNRFAFKKIKKGKLIGVIVGLVILIFLASQASRFWGVPSVEIYNPVNEAVVRNPDIEISLKISPQDKLTINNEVVAVDSDGYFKKNFNLQPGINTFEFKVKRFLGKEIVVTKTVIYQE